MVCIKDQCRSPVACGGFGYCRDLNQVLGLEAAGVPANRESYLNWHVGVKVLREIGVRAGKYPPLTAVERRWAKQGPVASSVLETIRLGAKDVFG